VNLNIARPSSHAPQSLALYERLRSLSDSSTEEQTEVLLSGLFNIVSQLESESGEAD